MTHATEPTWLTEARKYDGVREIPGVNHHPLILGWWKAIKRGGIQSDEVPWCAAFVGAMLEAVGIASTRFESAASYVAWGVRLDAPVVGCIVVFSRDGGNHVGFYTGQTHDGRWLIFGGNQGDEVNTRAFDPRRAVALRWPIGVPVPAGGELATGNAPDTTGEA